ERKREREIKGDDSELSLLFLEKIRKTASIDKETERKREMSDSMVCDGIAEGAKHEEWVLAQFSKDCKCSEDIQPTIGTMHK
ncbi:hypothetical protein ALC57_04699, partial [Trachymyrmex cornetzi]